ncbi:LacI family DNA-binding transcriptional regulator [Halobacillus sp. Marseille-P3879]|uniref:LacI family DNA-binding transcriptional regulator n=1 Tax=Halobacillus TaxID=45667 RepID=UPI000C7C1F19|nr:LacI family DNA-binding transcriptional regulator [Halobacillus sp. Marseille-P3879]
MATIEDVARLAGLSRTTVSRVINDQPYVTEEKKEKIIEAMEQLGYVPNSSARRLRSQRTETIAVLLPRVTNPFFGHLIEAMELKASEYGYQVIVCQTHDKKQKELDYLQLLKTKQVDGVVMTSLANQWKAIEPYLESGPVVLCNEYMETEQVSMVHIDHRQAAYDATVHLIEQGCNRIAYSTGSQETHITDQRKQGFLQALNDYKLVFPKELEINGALDVKDGQQVFSFLQQQAQRVDGIFTGSDEVAAGIIYAASESGWKIPEDLAVIGFDNQMISLLMAPAITTIQQPVDEMAKKTIEILVGKIKSEEYRLEKQYVYNYELLKRKSTERLNIKESAST